MKRGNRMCPMHGWKAIFFSCLIVGLLSTSACQKNSANSKQPDDDEAPTENAPELPAREFVTSVIERYKRAEQYADNGKLTLTYTLEGQPFKEFYSCDVSYGNSHKLKASFFNARVVSNERRLVSFVFDSQTFNLDGQHVVLPVSDSVPVAKLLDDAIWTHYGCGLSELPVEPQTENMAQFMSPVLHFFSDVQCATWLTSTKTQWSYESPSTIEGSECWGLSATFENQEFKAWVDKEQLLIRAVQLPSGVLSGVTNATGKDVLGGVKIMFEMEQATWQPDVLPGQFEFSDNATWKPVRKFIPVPEKFPTRLIGEHQPSFTLKLTNGEAWSGGDKRQNPTVIVWTPESLSTNLLEKLAAEARRTPTTDFLLVVTTPGAKAELGDQQEVSNFYTALDLNAEVARRFGFEAFPALVVVGATDTIQYAQAPLEEDWLKSASATLERLANGEDVAAEMKQSYGEFVSKYQKQLSEEREALGDLVEGE